MAPWNAPSPFSWRYGNASDFGNIARWLFDRPDLRLGSSRILSIDGTFATSYRCQHGQGLGEHRYHHCGERTCIQDKNGCGGFLSQSAGIKLSPHIGLQNSLAVVACKMYHYFQHTRIGADGIEFIDPENELHAPLPVEDFTITSGQGKGSRIQGASPERSVLRALLFSSGMPFRLSALNIGTFLVSRRDLRSEHVKKFAYPVSYTHLTLPTKA